MQEFSELIIDGALPTIDAMRRIDAAGRRIVFIAPGGKLSAALTDSDIRRYILRGGDLARPAAEAANHSPKWLPAEKRAAAQGFMVQNYIDAVPLLDKNGVMVEVVFVNEAAAPPAAALNMPVVIMAGGLGSRLYPYTKILPKPLIPVGDVPILERVIENFTRFGCREFWVIVNYRRNMIKSYFAEIDKNYTITWVDETEPLGTGGGLSLLKGAVRGAFFFTYCDVLIEADYADLAGFHREQNSAVTMVCATKQLTIPYGVVQIGENGGYAGLREKPSMNYLINAGLYVVAGEVLNAIAPNTPIGFPDVIEAQRAAGRHVGLYPVGEAAFMDMGRLEELEDMRRRLEQGQGQPPKA